MNKRLALVTFLILSTLSSSVWSMQEPIKTETITYSHPFKTSKHLKICAFANGIKIGSVKYKKENKGYWYLSKLSVDIAYRKTKNNIGFNLFSKCIANILSKKPTKMHWFVTRIKDDSPCLQALISIYKKMVGKLNLSEGLKVELYDTCAFMELTFDKSQSP